MKNGYVFRDEFNRSDISRHRKQSAAVKAAIAWNKSFDRNHTKGSYLPVSLLKVQDGHIVAIVRFDCNYKDPNVHVDWFDTWDVHLYEAW